MRVLIVEDDRLAMRSIALMLDRNKILHEAVDDGETAIEYARSDGYDAILLDLNLPDLHGSEVLRQMRKLGVATPVIILSGEDAVASKIDSFCFGADDYVTKPFSQEELVARIHALVRRSKGHSETIVSTGAMSVDLMRRDVRVGGHRVDLTGKEYAILELLTMRKGIVLEKGVIMTHLYNGRDEPEMKIVDVFVCKLRKKLAEAGNGAAACIETVWGRGYVLREPKADPAAAGAVKSPSRPAAPAMVADAVSTSF